MRLPVVAPEVGPLTDALAAALPGRIDGLDSLTDAVEVRVRGADLTPAEGAILQNLVAVHNGAAIRQARVAKVQRKQLEHAKDPTKLTDKERLTRIEILLGAD